MRILFTGGGTGGHFYPIIAVAEELREVMKDKRLLDAEFFYMAPTPYNEGLLYDLGIEYKKVSAGKIRKYFSLLNAIDFFKTSWGVVKALYLVYSIYPDVIFGKGGYGSFPALLAAKFLKIPVVIHESDTVPGRVNLWAGKFAERVAVSYREAAQYFPAGKVAHTGNPIRKEIRSGLGDIGREYLKIEEKLPIVLILGGSQGAEAINEVIVEALPELLKNYIVIHQTGHKNFSSVKATADAVLHDSPWKERYRPYDYLNAITLKNAASAASVIISRAGSTIFEIAAWAIPSIIIPIPESISHDQRSNAYAYARSGACEVIDENNLTSHILIAEIVRLTTDNEVRNKMKTAAKTFDKPDAAKLIAEEVLKIALSHETL